MQSFNGIETQPASVTPTNIVESALAPSIASIIGNPKELSTVPQIAVQSEKLAMTIPTGTSENVLPSDIFQLKLLFTPCSNIRRRRPIVPIWLLSTSTNGIRFRTEGPRKYPAKICRRRLLM
jgi:hypothetical protein